MVHKKTQSKRISCAKRYKIARKVAEHRRKERKEAKKNPRSNKLKKDPGIPNLWPFKHQLLNKIDQQKRKAEDEKQRQKEARNALFNKNRNINFSSLVEDASKRDVAFEENSKDPDSVEDDISTAMDAVAIGQKDNSRKAYYKEFREVIEAADVILEILDARDPLGYRTKEIEKMVNNSGSGKKIILILNKIDLVPRENVTQWLEYLRKDYPTVAFKSSTQTQRKNLGHSSLSTTKISDNKLQHSNECLGADDLIQLLKNYCRNCNIKTSIVVGVIGYPNVGKSSVINSLKRSKVCGVGATPGLTKHAQEIHLDKNIKLLDSPGIVFARDQGDDKNSEILLKNCVKIEQLDDPISPVELIVSRCSAQQLMNKYNVPMFRDVNDFLIHVARQRGKLKRGGIPNIDAAARIILQDWNSGNIPYFTTPPTSTITMEVENN
ncbi:guanine nucleotide-binding protein-like 3 [Gigaspora margarita]|uniref:Guanine nucleotide-binding protein-like 3 n=1 Tax=Gigaspora margarita TaxID=4874 RepID=A0A8H3XFD0_GIGMA|nr:guanine nucleotide-binding protein-like 3 [Gigaspora margarita]